ncbi:MAG: hypothetical protein A3E01_06580 [Gammaproteobacteria bacterium RIFCSPHIGHO2_12_FULL_63_22]|nr:MAG: hypothetical protein A3E01_06580 [Gammaproteobacteria bacterium RIFCSPHIGHO2_12_FULL_63_22]
MSPSIPLDLDSQVAQKVLGWKPHHLGFIKPDGKLITWQSGWMPKFSTTWGGMGDLIAALEAQGFSWWLQGATNWPKTATVGESKFTADTAPQALAMAALAAIEAEA